MITARDKSLSSLTLNHLTQLQIQIDNIPIYFSGGNNKALYVKKHLEQSTQSFTRIIFVDDMEPNLKDVYDAYDTFVQKEVPLNLYQMKIDDM